MWNSTLESGSRVAAVENGKNKTVIIFFLFSQATVIAEKRLLFIASLVYPRQTSLPGTCVCFMI